MANHESVADIRQLSGFLIESGAARLGGRLVQECAGAGLLVLLVSAGFEGF
jgi:hypothetical protein